ncbi:M16 family metallopeptidase [Streptomyces sp. NRRL F-5650]|uniref:M16 family metallopeptidase n=1 Tax=Streptomyces sp. NRRL F-5650 TaxID=1463868 RepID=UPI0004C4B0CB|nr:insulinase family protein [Streptomyces sp. NRRL F-5650]
MSGAATRAGGIPPLAPHPPIPLPPHLDTRLPNGLRVVAVHAATTHLAEVRLFLPLPAHTTDPAAAAVLTALVSARIARRTSAAGAAPAHDGSVIGAARAGDHLVLSASVPADRLRECLGLFAGILTDPHHTPAACAAVAHGLAERTRRAPAPLGRSAQEELVAHCFPSSPHARQPSPDALAAVTPHQVAAVHRATARPRDAFLVVVGPGGPGRALATSTAAFESWEDTGAPAGELPPPWSDQGIDVRERKGVVQAQFALAAPVPPRTDPDFAALSIGNCLFGGYFSSRLMQRMRERDGLVYQIESTIDEILANPAAVITCATAPEKAGKTLTNLRNEIEGLLLRPPTGHEIDAAREYMIGVTYIGQTSQAGLASALAGVLAGGLDPGWLHDFPEQLRAVTPHEVTGVLARHYPVEAFSGVVLTAAAGTPDLRAV